MRSKVDIRLSIEELGHIVLWAGLVWSGLVRGILRNKNKPRSGLKHVESSQIRSVLKCNFCFDLANALTQEAFHCLVTYSYRAE